MNVTERLEHRVMAVIRERGQYIGKVGCVLCLPMRKAAGRLAKQGKIKYVGRFDGRDVWESL